MLLAQPELVIQQLDHVIGDLAGFQVLGRLLDVHAAVAGYCRDRRGGWADVAIGRGLLHGSQLHRSPLVRGHGSGLNRHLLHRRFHAGHLRGGCLFSRGHQLLLDPAGNHRSLASLGELSGAFIQQLADGRAIGVLLRVEGADQRLGASRHVLTASGIDHVAAGLQLACVAAHAAEQVLVANQVGADLGGQLGLLDHRVELLGVAEQVHLVAFHGAGRLAHLHHFTEGRVGHVAALQHLPGGLHPGFIEGAAAQGDGLAQGDGAIHCGLEDVLRQAAERQALPAEP